MLPTPSLTAISLGENARAPRWVALLILGIALLIGVSVGGSAREASAYNLCDNNGVCTARWYNHLISWKDLTGWGGSKGGSVYTAGIKWDLVPDTLSVGVDPSPTGPYQVVVALYNLDSLGLFAPGWTWAYKATGDVYSIVGAESYLNTTWTWYTDGTMNQSLKRADVLTITLHEMGHWLFLGHPCGTQPGAVMCPQYVKKWNLTQDDTFGAQALYY